MNHSLVQLLLLSLLAVAVYVSVDGVVNVVELYIALVLTARYLEDR